MNGNSPKNEEQVAAPLEKASLSPQKNLTQTPQNTLLNLAKLNTGAPRFEMNSKENEDTGNVNVMVENEMGKVDVQIEKMENVVGGDKDKVNGVIEEISGKVEVPEDELMRIKSDPEEKGEEVVEKEDKREEVNGGVDMGNEENGKVKEEVQEIVMENEDKEEEQDQKEEVVEEVIDKVVQEVVQEVSKIQEEVVQVKPEEVVQVEPEVVAEVAKIEEEVVNEVVERVEEEPKIEVVEEIQAEQPILEEIEEKVVETEQIVMEEKEEKIVEEVVNEVVPIEPVPEVQIEPMVESEVVPETKPEVIIEPMPEDVPVLEEIVEITPNPVKSESEPEEEVKDMITQLLPRVEEPQEVQEVPVITEKEPEMKIQEEQPEEEEEEVVQKIEEEETPEVVNPVLERNAQISEDEKDEEYDMEGQNNVYAWGSAECDQFECENYESRRPVEIKYFSSNKVNVSKITCGSQHTLLLDSTGKVYSWGNSDDGALGREVSGSSNDEKPGLVDLDGQVDLISAGDAHSVFANSKTGELYFSGVIKSSNGKLSRVVDLPESITISKFKKSGIKTVLSGANHVLIHSRFNVYAFGDNSTGALGYILRSYDDRTDCLTPHALRLKGIARIFTGAYHSFAITNKGILKTWGLNSQGQLGLPFYLDNPEDSDINHEDPNRNPNVLQLPHQVGGIDGKQIVDIVGGEHHSIMLMTDGSLWGAGRNDDGQLGGLVKPERESYDEVKIPNSRVRVAGTNNYVNVTIDYMPNTFMRLPIKKTFQKIQSISHYNYAINTSEKGWPKVYTWGSGFNYVLGNGKEETVSNPFRVSNNKLFKGEVPTEVALGFSHVVYYTGDKHPVDLEIPKPRSKGKRDNMQALKRSSKYKGKRVKNK